MTVVGKLYTYPNNSRAQKVLIAAKYAGVEVDVPPFVFGVDNVKPEYIAKFRVTMVPTFEGRHGEVLFESNAIARYVASQTADGAKLLGTTPIEQALVASFTDLIISDLNPASNGWLYPMLGFRTFDEAVVEHSKKAVQKSLATFDRILADKTYLVGESVTLADIAFALTALNLYKMVLDPEFRAPYPNVNRYFVTLVNQPHFKAVLGEVHLSEKMAVYQPKPAAAPAPAPAPAKAAEKPAAAEPAKKADKKAKKDDEEEEEEEDYEEKPKEKNPLDLLPPSTFNLEAWKRFYSNNEESDSIKFFWENLDKNGFTVYFADYADNPIKGNKFFMTCNLVGGAFQRLEEVRKYGFASYCIFGGDGENEIHGFWVFRGSDIPREVRESPDFESYTYTKADLDDKAQRERINAFLAWKEIDGVASFGGVSKLPFAEGKIFK